MRVFFTTTTPNTTPETHLLPPAETDDLVAALAAADHPRFACAGDAESADVIIYVEPQHLGRLRTFRRKLLSEALIRQYPNKCFTFDYTPEPIGFLPGVYTHMPARKWEKHRFRAGGYHRTFNPLVDQYEAERDRTPRLLYSFRGIMSHPVRQLLFDAGLSTPDTPVERVETWGGKDDDERTSYFEQILDTRFVLCPRGWGTSSIRMYEAMQLGRVPVIIADEWVAPEGPAWSKFSIRVSESRIGEIPGILKQREGDFGAMAVAARQAWEEWFSPSVRLIHALEEIEYLLLVRPADHDEAKLQRKWTSFAFEWKNGISVPQSVYWLARNGLLTERGKDHLLSRFNEIVTVQQPKPRDSHS
ncbi:MAG TPA: exostosin family protein [Capsulimonadaceae bacterium]|jgi:hypothetical protein